MGKATNKKLQWQKDHFRELFKKDKKKFEGAWELIDRSMLMLHAIGEDAFKLHGEKTYAFLTNAAGKSLANVCDKRIYRLTKDYTRNQ